MATPSLPPYDEYESSAPPGYQDQQHTSSSSATLKIPEYTLTPPHLIDVKLTFHSTIEIYRFKFPHFTLSHPLTDSTPPNVFSPRTISLASTRVYTISHGISMVPESIISIHSGTTEETPVLGKVRVASSKTHIITLYGKPKEVTARGTGGAPNFVTFTYPKGKEKAHWFEFDRGGREGKERFEWVVAMDSEVSDSLTSTR